jgi:hypothetical protein
MIQVSHSHPPKCQQICTRLFNSGYARLRNKNISTGDWMQRIALQKSALQVSLESTQCFADSRAVKEQNPPVFV